MIDFVNTLDTVNDVVLADKLIDRSISGVFNDDKITTIGSHAFAYCKNLESVCFPVATSIGAGAFRGSGLKAITPETFPFLTQIGYMYGSYVFGESALETVDWPSLTSVSEYRVFQACKSLRSVSLPNLTTIRDATFWFNGCTSLKDVYLPVATRCPGFGGCTSLETITLPLVTDTPGSTFINCTGLKVIDLPSCVGITGECAFENCPALEALILRSTTMCTLTTANIFGGSTSIKKGEGHIYVPRNLVDSYKSATNWSNYAAQFRAIEDYPDICGG